VADPVTLAVLGGLALTEGVKFLYNQAGALLDAWRKRREKAADAAAAAAAPDDELPGLAQDPALDGDVDSDRRPDPDRVAARVADLEAALDALDPYVRPRGARPVDPKDATVRADVGRVRDLLEDLYGQRLTLKGENREPTGTVLHAEVRVARTKDSQVLGMRNAASAPPGTKAEATVDATDLDHSTVAGIDF
jgi:hypothetical protein